MFRARNFRLSGRRKSRHPVGEAGSPIIPCSRVGFGPNFVEPERATRMTTLGNLLELHLTNAQSLDPGAGLVLLHKIHFAPKIAALHQSLLA
jgi:hypothetical protein